ASTRNPTDDNICCRRCDDALFEFCSRQTSIARSRLAARSGMFFARLKPGIAAGRLALSIDLAVEEPYAAGTKPLSFQGAGRDEARDVAGAGAEYVGNLGDLPGAINCAALAGGDVVGVQCGHWGLLRLLTGLFLAL